MTQQFTPSQQDFILLSEAGFIAINQGDEDAAVKLFHAAELMNPKNTLPRIGMGYLHFLKLELKQAGEIFQKILATEPENEMANALYGLSMALNPQDMVKGEKLLQDTAKNAKDPTVKNMALTAVEFVEKFVKRGSPSAPGPQEKNTKK